tara:strand:+ start:757 stop:1458 length:702 start_codon:yes stop_codon:yes gene_type:complete
MKFKNKLLQGSLIKRYKRFFVDIKYQNKTITAHCPNSGSMMGLINPSNKAFFSQSDDPKRKLKYTLEMVEVNKKMIGVNTHLTNKIFYEALRDKKIKNLENYTNIKREVVFSEKTRFDFLVFLKQKKTFLEVKNVTLSREQNIAEFPDAITSRGTRHLNELINAKKKGYESYIVYIVQRDDCKSFKIANDIDKKYKNAFDNALENGVKILCYDCKLTDEEIIINNQIQYDKKL